MEREAEEKTDITTIPPKVIRSFIQGLFDCNSPYRYVWRATEENECVYLFRVSCTISSIGFSQIASVLLRTRCANQRLHSNWAETHSKRIKIKREIISPKNSDDTSFDSILNWEKFMQYKLKCWKVYVRFHLLFKCFCVLVCFEIKCRELGENKTCFFLSCLFVHSLFVFDVAVFVGNQRTAG